MGPDGAVDASREKRTETRCQRIVSVHKRLRLPFVPETVLYIFQYYFNKRRDHHGFLGTVTDNVDNAVTSYHRHGNFVDTGTVKRQQDQSGDCISGRGDFKGWYIGIPLPDVPPPTRNIQVDN